MRRAFLYLVGVMDWSTRKVLFWRVSNTMDVEFCVEALEKALTRSGLRSRKLRLLAVCQRVGIAGVMTLPSMGGVSEDVRRI